MFFDHDNWSGGEFLALYGALLALAFYLGFAIPRWLRSPGRAPGPLDDEQAAYLSGGIARFCELVVARLFGRGLVSMAPDRMIAIAETGERQHAVEGKLFALPSPASWGTIEDTLRADGRRLRDRLVSDGLLMDPARVDLIRLCQTVPYLLLIALGLSRWRYGSALDHPTGFLIAFLILTAIFALIRWFTPETRTRRGISAIEVAQERAQRLRLAPTAGEFPLAVALFGTVVLAGSSWNDFHLMRTDGNGNSNDGGGCGGGGGGCGGCGGCGG